MGDQPHITPTPEMKQEASERQESEESEERLGRECDPGPVSEAMA